MAASIIVRFGGNLDDLKKAIAEGKVLIENSSSAMDKLAAKLSGAKAAADAERWAGAIRKVGDATKLTAADVERANTVFARAMEYYRAAGKDVPPELREIAEATKAVADQNRILEERAKASTEVLSRQGESLKNVGSGLQSVGTGLTAGVTAPLAGLGAVALRATAQVNEGLFAIRQATGATGERFAELKTTFENVYRSVPQEAQVVGQAIGEIATRTGRTGAALEDLTKQLLDLANISRTEVGPLVAAATRLFGDWSIATEKQTGALDYLWRTSQATGIQVQRLAELVVQFGAPMRALGYSFEQSTALLGKWEKEGVNIETILSGLRFALGKFAAAGVEPQRALAQVITAIKAAKTESEATGIAFQVFGRRAAIDMARAIVEGRLDIDALVQSLITGRETIASTDDATKAFAERLAELSHEVDLALAPLGQELQQALSDLIPLLKDAAKTLGDLVKAFADLPAPIQKAVLGAAGIAAALGPIAIAAGAAVTGVGNLLLILDRLQKARAAAAATGAIADGLTGIGTAAGGAATLVSRLGAALAGLGAATAGLLAIRTLAGSWQGAFEDIFRTLRGQAPINIPAHFTGLDQPLPGKKLEVDIELAPNAPAFGPQLPPGQTAGATAGAIDLSTLLKGAGAGGESPAQRVAKEVKELGELWAAAKAHGADLGAVIADKGKAFIDAALQARIWGVAVSDAFAEGLAAARTARLDVLLADVGKGFTGWAAEARKSFADAAKDWVDTWAKAGAENLQVSQDYGAKLADLETAGLARRLQQIDRQHAAALEGLHTEAIGYQEAKAAVDGYYQHQRDLAIGTADTIVERMRAAGVATRADLEQTATEARRDYEQMRDSGVFTAEDIYAAWKRWYDADQKARGTMTAGWLESLSALADSFQELAQIAGGSLASIARTVGTLVSSLGLATKSLDQAKQGIAGLKEGFSLKGLGDIASGFLGIASAAVSAGKAVVQFFSDLFGHHTEKDIKQKLKEWGVDASEELVKTIADDVKQLGGEVESSIYHLADVIEEAGGVTAENYRTFVAKLHDVFSLVGAGKFDRTQAAKVLDENFKAFEDLAREAAKQTGGVLGREIRELIGLDKAFGTGSKAIGDLIQRELTSAVGGLTAFFGQYQEATAGVEETRQALADATARLAKATTATERAEAQKQVDELRARLGEQQRVAEAFTIDTQAKATGFAAALAGSFAALRQQGVPIQDLLKQFEPAVSALEAQLAKAGLSGGAAFDALRAQIALVKDAVTGPLIQGITDAGQGLVGLFNANILTPDMWVGLTQQIGSMWQQLGNKGPEALAVLQPQLQAMWEIWKETGWAVDETTRKMLEDAEAAGLVGEAHKSASDQMVDGVNAINDTLREGLGALLTAFGVDLPESFRKTKKAADEELGGMVPPDLTPTVDQDALEQALEEMKRRVDGVDLPPVDIGIEVDPWFLENPFPDGGTWEQQQAWMIEAAKHNRGQTMARLHEGGLVTASLAPQIVPRAHGGLNPDEFPVILQTGERVLNRRETAVFDVAVATARSSPAPAAPVTVEVYQISAMDSQDVAAFFERKGVRAWNNAVRVNAGHIAPEVKATLAALLGL